MIDCIVCRAAQDPSPPSIAYPRPLTERGWDADDRIRGMFIGAALGDAIAGLQRRHEPIPARPAAASLRTGSFTQLVLFAAEGSIRMAARAFEKGIGPAWDILTLAVVRWMYTQPDAPRERLAELYPMGGWPGGWLVTEHVLHEQRGRPPTTREAILAGSRVEQDDHHRLTGTPNQDDGAGFLPRSAASFVAIPDHLVFETGARVSAATHGAPEAHVLGGVVAHAMSRLVAGDGLQAAFGSAIAAARQWPDHEHVTERITKALETGAAVPGSHGAFRALEQALAMAARDRRFDEVLTTASGNAAILALAGQLLGAQHGARSIRADWRVAPDLVNVIEELADASSLAHRVWNLNEPLPDAVLAAHHTADSPLTGHLWERFPGW